jgi:hypothetical protein
MLFIRIVIAWVPSHHVKIIVLGLVILTEHPDTYNTYILSGGRLPQSLAVCNNHPDTCIYESASPKRDGNSQCDDVFTID